jgi:hypothetical protein
MYQICTSTPDNSGELRGLTDTQIPVASRANAIYQVALERPAEGS